MRFISVNQQQNAQNVEQGHGVRLGEPPSKTGAAVL